MSVTESEVVSRPEEAVMTITRIHQRCRAVRKTKVRIDRMIRVEPDAGQALHLPAAGDELQSRRRPVHIAYGRSLSCEILAAGATVR